MGMDAPGLPVALIVPRLIPLVLGVPLCELASGRNMLTLSQSRPKAMSAEAEYVSVGSNYPAIVLMHCAYSRHDSLPDHQPKADAVGGSVVDAKETGG